MAEGALASEGRHDVDNCWTTCAYTWKSSGPSILCRLIRSLTAADAGIARLNATGVVKTGVLSEISRMVEIGPRGWSCVMPPANRIAALDLGSRSLDRRPDTHRVFRGLERTDSERVFMSPPGQ